MTMLKLDLFSPRFTYIWLMFTVTAGKHTSHMDTAGVELLDFCRIPSFESHIINQSPQGVDLKLVGPATKNRESQSCSFHGLAVA